MQAERRYRVVEIGSDIADVVTVGIEQRDGAMRAAVWWPSKGDVDADEAEYEAVPAALDAAEAARTLHGFAAVVVTLTDRALWQAEWGKLAAEEPLGDLRGTDLSDAEAYQLAAGIEAERDA